MEKQFKMTDDKKEESVPKEEQSLLSSDTTTPPTVQIIAKKDEGKTLNLKWAHTKYGNVKIIVMSYQMSSGKTRREILMPTGRPHLINLDINCL